MSEWEWPEELDALVAAADSHRLLMENDYVRVLETLIPSGVKVPVHTHRWPSVQYILSWSDFVRRGADGNVLFDTRGKDWAMTGKAVWSEPLVPHSVENVGGAELRVILVEQKKG